MGEQRGGLPHGGVVDTTGVPGVSVVAASGFVSFAVLSEMLARGARTIDADENTRVVVIDLGAIEGFEPGVPAKLIAWLGARSGRLAAAVVITARPAIQALVRAAEVMVPTIVCVAAPNRNDGVAIAMRFAESRARSQTGIRRRTLIDDEGEKTA